jgi:signal transduction histidine kinase
MNKVLKNPFFAGGVVITGLVVIMAVLFPEFVRGIFSANSFMPHKHCYLDDPRMIWLHVISDLFIGLAYVSISTTLGYLVYRSSKNIPFHWMFLAFGLFIVSCGFTHFMEILTVWYPYYWLAGYIKAITAVASVTTAITLFPLVPRIFGMIEAVKVSEDRRVKLAAANQELEAFAYSISHDLRAPLRTMQGMARALQEDFGPEMSSTAKDYSGKIIAASVRMDNLIMNLLEYSRVNLVEFELVAVDSKSVLDEVQASIAANVEAADATITLEGNFPPVMANRALLMQAVSNLLINGTKFVAAGVKPQLTVRAEKRMSGVRIFFKDNGIGIASEHQQRIFKMFERLHSGTEYAGTGVGLAIVQRAVTRMGGTMGLESQPDKGSTFWIELAAA